MRFCFSLLLSTLSLHFSLAQVVPYQNKMTLEDSTSIQLEEFSEKHPQDSLFPGPPTYFRESNLKKSRTRLLGLGFGACQLIDASSSLTRDSATQWLSLNNNRSTTWRIHLLEHKLPIYHEYIGIYTGLSIAFNGFGLASNSDLIETEAMGMFANTVDPAARRYTKNKLRITALQIPLMLEFDTNKDTQQSCSIAIGAIGAWVTSSLTKQKWEAESSSFTLRKKDDFLVNPLTLELCARFGYRNSALFFTYSLTPLFRKNIGSAVFPVTLGIQLIRF
jgi:hypothetical protein